MIRTCSHSVAAEAYGTWGADIEANPDLMFEPILERFRGGADFKAQIMLQRGKILPFADGIFVKNRGL